MYRIISASKDTYITNKVVNGVQVTDANVGQAGTLDLFRLYNESTISGQTGTVDEVSRILIKFDLDLLRELTGSILDIDDSSFNVTMNMADVFGGQTVPSNFTIAVFPLSKSFDEGQGRDVRAFRDLDAANFITSSVSVEVPVTWSVSGAADGTNDYISTQGAFQSFELGTEDLSIDVTSIVSQTLKGDLPDLGFRVSYSGTHETDNRSRFVKRFGSRHAVNPLLRPHLVAKWDDSLQDDHENMFFGCTSTLYLNNSKFSQLANIMSGASEITGADSLILRLKSGSANNTVVSGTVVTGSVSGTQFLSQSVNAAPSTFFEKIITASQLQIGSNFVTGVYCATFAIDETETSILFDEVKAAGSATFTEIWESLDGTIGYLTSSLVIKRVDRTAFSSDFSADPAQMIVRVTNNLGHYDRNEKARFRVYAQRNERTRVIAARQPLVRKSIILKEMFYQIRDMNSRRIVIPFDDPATKLSTDSDGMYFDIFMDSLDPGLVYAIELKFTDRGVTEVFDLNELGAAFRVNT